MHAQRLEAVGTVACQLTHEIKNALAPIIGAVELAQLTLPEEHRAHSHLSQITRATERAGDLAQKILCFGKTASSRGSRMTWESSCASPSICCQPLCRAM